ncbi:MAG: pirin family protein [Alphaproteobacteria bacterium]|nr:pirin family protein [Alphaproteobacteria bacterium]
MGSEGEASSASREIEHVVRGMPTSDGAGVKLLRVLTQNLQRRLDPFLMLDEFRSDDPGDYIAGFPDHPHRGFETVTYMIAGRMRHRDTTGGEGLLTAGGVQWMTAGRGLVHSELPEQEAGLMHGFQLWLNLPARDKMIAPGYRDIPATEIPETRIGDATVRVVAGRCGAVAGAVTRPATEPLYLDVIFPAAGAAAPAIPAGHNAFVYCYEGALAVGARRQVLPKQAMAILDNGDGARGVRLAATGPARALVIAGRPLNEPIAQWGPFVMNTRAEIERAVDDYRSGRF